MKTVLLFFCSLVSTLSIAQIQTRELVKGKIHVATESSAENIDVYNINSGKGTYTNPDGEFIIAVRKGDKLLVSGLQYQEFKVVVDEGIVKNRKMEITINEGINKLDEVVVRPYNLSGDISVDVNKLNTEKANLPSEKSKAMVETYGYEFRPTKNSEVENDAMDKHYLTNGLNFVNIFKAIVNTKDKEEKKTTAIDAQVRKMYNNEFFKENLNIQESQINNFINYAQQHGLTNKMLEKGNELELIEFLIDTSKEFKAQHE